MPVEDNNGSDNFFKGVGLFVKEYRRAVREGQGYAWGRDDVGEAASDPAIAGSSGAAGGGGDQSSGSGGNLETL